MSKLMVTAESARLDEVMAFVGRHLEKTDCRDAVRTQVELAVEEIFINIAKYAYHPESGPAMVRCEVTEQPCSIIIEFLDSGTPYNPLETNAPALDESPEQRPVGGLGVFLTRRLMDGVEYRFEGGKNILTLTKRLDGTECG